MVSPSIFLLGSSGATGCKNKKHIFIPLGLEDVQFEVCIIVRRKETHTNLGIYSKEGETENPGRNHNVPSSDFSYHMSAWGYT